MKLGKREVDNSKIVDTYNIFVILYQIYIMHNGGKNELKR